MGTLAGLVREKTRWVNQMGWYEMGTLDGLVQDGYTRQAGMRWVHQMGWYEMGTLDGLVRDGYTRWAGTRWVHQMGWYEMGTLDGLVRENTSRFNPCTGGDHSNGRSPV